jgi:hypothetical protein
MGDVPESVNTIEMPWYRFGTRLCDIRTAAQAVQKAGLDWKVIKKVECEGQKPGQCELVREDIWDHNGRGVLGYVRVSSTPLQNVEAFTLFDPLVQNGATRYDCAGAWGQGEWVWMIIRFCEEIEIAPGDSVGQFLLFGHAPATGYYRLAYIPVRLASGSLLIEDAFHNPEPLVSIPNVRPRQFLESEEVVLEQLNSHFKLLTDKFRAMSQMRFSQEHADNYFVSVFEEFAREQGELKKDLPTPGEIQIGCMASSLLFNRACNDLEPESGTLWAAYCAFTEYFDYQKAVPANWEYLREIWFSPLKASALRVAIKLAQA